MSPRGQFLSMLVDRLAAVNIGHPLRVGIDGPCGSGKSTLARELVAAIAASGRAAVYLDSDGFHNPRHVRYRRGRDSARGYYEDAYDFRALVDRVLVPLGPGGSRLYATKVHDLDTDRVEVNLAAAAPNDAIVIFDCTFLQRGQLRDYWDEVVYLRVRRDIAVTRGAGRDAARFGGFEDARKAHDARYMAACDIYIREEHPAERASILIDHDDFANPIAVRGFKSG